MQGGKGFEWFETVLPVVHGQFMVNIYSRWYCMVIIWQLGFGYHTQQDTFCSAIHAVCDACYQPLGKQPCRFRGIYHGGQQDSVFYPLSAERSGNGSSVMGIPMPAAYGYLGFDFGTGHSTIGIPELEMAKRSNQRIMGKRE
jgi:hypothetical protein